MRDDSDVKAKMSEMNEEKRTKLREIEVRCRIGTLGGILESCLLFFNFVFLIGYPGEGHEVPG